MTDEKMVCSSCNVRIANAAGRAVFECPSCGKERIVRCPQCRKNAVKYKCSKCGFSGPN